MDRPTLRVRTPLTDAQLNTLFAAAWPNHTDMAFGPIHERSLTWISAWRGERLVGYVNVATDGGVHAFLLNTTVHPVEQLHTNARGSDATSFIGDPAPLLRRNVKCHCIFRRSNL